MIAIKNMSMPKSCSDCPMCRPKGKDEPWNFCCFATMTDMELGAMMEQFLKATDTEKYVDNADMADIIVNSKNPGQAMPELIRWIGKKIFEERKDDIIAQIESDSDEKLDLFEVTYTWKQTISAQTEEDAIAIARNNRSSYGNNNGTTSNYEAKRAEFISPQGEKR